jgi:hypothetical protein
MKRNLDIRLYLLPLFLMVVALLPACKKNNEGPSSKPPVVTSVRLYHASGKDTLLSTGNSKTDPNLVVGAGKYVVIIGQNLQNATGIDFDGVSTTFNPALLASGSAVVQIPNIIYSKIDTAKFYTLTYKTPAGSTTFSFKLGPPAPAIYSISNVFAQPGDSVYLFGSNLVLVQNLVYGGTPITKFKSSLYGDSLGFLMPATTFNRLVTVTTKSGTVLDTIKATPIISWISNENPSMGDSVYIYGTYLKGVQSLSFAGAAVTSFTTSTDAKSISFVAPALSSQSGPVSITTSYGTGTTPYHVNTQTYLQDGVIENMDGSGTLYADYGGNASGWGDGIGGIDAHINNRYGWFTETTAFNGVLGTNHTMFIFVNTGALSGGSSNNGIILASNQWVPAANLTDAPGNWALKLEISVPTDWNGGALDISPGGGYIYRWEPSSNGKPYKTKGWVTITIPLSSFRKSDPSLGEGKGVALANLTDMLGSKGQTGAYLYRHNYNAATTTTGFYVAFDNIRVVKIK